MDSDIPAKVIVCGVKDDIPPEPTWRGRPAISWAHQIVDDCFLTALQALDCMHHCPTWTYEHMLQPFGLRADDGDDKVLSYGTELTVCWT